MKSSCASFSRDSFANFSACTSAGSLDGTLVLPSLLDADAGREPEKLLEREQAKPRRVWEATDQAEVGRELGREATDGVEISSIDPKESTDIFEGCRTIGSTMEDGMSTSTRMECGLEGVPTSSSVVPSSRSPDELASFGP
jgi:hypothetical protein